jgi:hypothetical protein
MTAAEWLACDDPTALLAAARAGLSRRRLRLLTAGCVGIVADHAAYAACWRAAEVALRLADGQAGRKEVAEARRAVNRLLQDAAINQEFRYPIYAYFELLSARPGRAFDAAARWVWLACGMATERYRAHMLGLVRDVAGSPTRPDSIEPGWRTEAVIGLARGVYADRAYSRLPVLADALEDAGCDQPDLLDHFRGPGPHYPGCWAVDLVLGQT